MQGHERPWIGADLLVRRLRDHGVRHLFGYPGGPLAPIYDALYREPAVRHILARDERAAGFMADGYARATGRPGVCLAVCGPGVFNAATPVAEAFSDSVPVLLLNGQLPTTARGGARSGFYHENEQLAAFTPFTKFQAVIQDAGAIVPSLDQAWNALTTGRPGPAYVEAPINVMTSPVASPQVPPLPVFAPPPTPRPGEIEALARLINDWHRPLLMVGGGAVSSGASAVLVELAERLAAPVFHSLMGKGAIPSEHPLCAGMPWKEGTSDASEMASKMSPLFAQADGLLAIGCRFTQVITGTWALKPPASLAQIDIDARELGRHYEPALGIHADAGATLSALLEVLPAQRRRPWAPPAPPPAARRLEGLDLLSPLRRVLPADAIVVADVTRLGYMMLVDHPVCQPRAFLHPACGVSMGYGLPAALGAKTAFPDRTVVAVMGDGGFQMTGMELATAVQEKLPVVVVLINDNALSLIKAIQHRRYEGRFLGVDLRNPDFEAFARAFGVRAWRVEGETEFESALGAAIALGEPALVEVRIQHGPK